MKEKVTAGNDPDFRLADVWIQWEKDHMNVSLGLEPRSEDGVPQLHFVDALYGGAPTQTRIGRLFCQRMGELGFVDSAPDCMSPDAEAEFHSQVGRVILDCVTGSSTLDGIWTNMNRPSVNRLVRILRRARDDSFGRDE